MTRLIALLTFLALPFFVFAQTTSPERLAAVDAYALAAKPQHEKTVVLLATYLKGAGPSETERARAAYAWVAHRIAYDAPLFFGQQGQMNIATAEQAKTDPRFVGQVPEAVLANRKGVCLGYSRLVESLCREMGLTAYVVNGFAKGVPGQTSSKGGGPTHAWNVVMADGAWHLMDATWASGHLTPDQKFAPFYTDTLFFADPARFVQQHLPSDPAYQLLGAPVSKEAFWQPAVQVRKAGPYAYADTLAGSETVSVEESTYRSSLRALAFDPEAIYARLKIAEYHSERALAAMQDYQKGIEAFNRQQIAAATPQMLAQLDAAEQHLTVSKRMFDELPRSQIRQLPAAKENIRSIDENLEGIVKQRKFWASLK